MHRRSALLFAAVCLLAVRTRAACPDFAPPVTLNVTGSHYGVAVADINGDGRPDAAVPSLGHTSVRIFLGVGDGTFTETAPVHIGYTQHSAALADYDRDGKVDLATGNFSHHSASVALGKGDGTFLAANPILFLPSRQIVSVTLADVIGDPKLEVVGTTNGSTIVVGDAGFATAIGEYDVGPSAATMWVASGDLDGDERDDVVIANRDSSNVSVFFGGADGLTRGQDFPVGTTPLFIILTDVDGDGDLDAVTSNAENISMLAGNGDGTFAPVVNYPTPAGFGSAVSVAAGDLDIDGDVDLAFSCVVTQSGDQSGIAFLLQTEIGFELRAGSIENAISVNIADLNDDGRNDLFIGGLNYIASRLSDCPFPPRVGTIDPASGPSTGGQAVTIFGEHLGATTTVMFGSSTASILNNTDTEVTVSTPPHEPGTVDVYVTNAGGTADAPASYTYVIGAPLSLTATAILIDEVALSWPAVPGAAHYEVVRRSDSDYITVEPMVVGSTYNDTDVAENSSYVYKVRAVASDANSSPYSTPDEATTVMFVDDPLDVGILVKATHLAQMRTAVNAMRRAASLDEIGFIDAAQAGVAIRAIHIAELRDAVASARAALGLVAQMFTDTPLATSTVIKAAHMIDLRTAVR